MRAISLLFIASLTLAACDQNAPPTAKDPTPAPTSIGDDKLNDCPGADKDSCGEIPAATDNEQSKFGSDFALTKREALTDATERVGDAAETVQVSGTVDAVCAKKGCWMVLRDGDQTARVFTYAGNFYLPLNVAKGRKAVVEGELKSKTVSEKFAKHLAEDKGDDPSKVTGDQREWVMQATTIELL